MGPGLKKGGGKLGRAQREDLELPRTADGVRKGLAGLKKRFRRQRARIAAGGRNEKKRYSSTARDQKRGRKLRRRHKGNELCGSWGKGEKIRSRTKKKLLQRGRDSRTSAQRKPEKKKC